MIGMVRGIAVAAVLGVAACAQPVPPLFNLGDRACDAAPMLDAAVPVPFGDTRGVGVALTVASRCLILPTGVKTPYAVFRLPVATVPYQLTVSSLVTGGGVAAPIATVLGVNGATSRMIDPAAFHTDLSGFHTGLRLRPTETTLVVAADPSRVGSPMVLRLGLRDQHLTQLASRVIIIPVGGDTVPYEQPTSAVATLSLSGFIRVAATPVATVR